MWLKRLSANKQEEGANGRWGRAQIPCPGCFQTHPRRVISLWKPISTQSKNHRGTRHRQGSSSVTIEEGIPAQLQGCPRRTRAPALWDGNMQSLLLLEMFLVLDSCTVWAQKYHLVKWDRRLALFCLLLLKQQLTDFSLSRPSSCWLPQWIALSQLQCNWVDWLLILLEACGHLFRESADLEAHLVRWILPDFLKVFKFVSVLN